MITLNSNIFVSTLTNLIAYTYVLDSFNTAELNEVLDAFRGDNVPTGDGRVVFSVDIPEVVDLNTSTSSLLTVTKPTITEEYFPVTDFKVIPMTINSYLLRGAFTDDYAMNILTSYILQAMNAAKSLHMYDEVLACIAAFVGENSVETTSDTGYRVVTASDSAVEANAKKTYNANLLFRLLKKELHAISHGKKTAINGHRVVLGQSDLVVMMTPATMANIDIDSLATLLNSSQITKNIKVRFIEDSLPQHKGSPTLSDGELLIMQKDAVQYGYFYEVATEFFDASNLNAQHFLHFAYYTSVSAGGYFGKVKVTEA